MQLLQTLCIALLSLSLFACGGSLEGSTDTTDTTDTSDTTDTKDTSDTKDTTGVIELSARLLDCPSGWDQDVTLCTDTSEISALDPGIVAVSLSQAGVALTSQIVAATATKGSLTPDSVLTNSSGIAFFTLVANSDEGAGRISVTTDALEQETSNKLNFQIGASNVDIAIENDTEGVSLAQSSTALITVNLTTDEGAYSSPVKVSFSSACALEGSAKLDTSVTAINGVAQATYQPIGCVGDDVITASAEVNNLSASTTINVASSPAQSIRYIGASPQWLAIKGTGGAGRQETSTLTFKLVDKNGGASSQQEVEFILDSGPSGTVIEPLLAKTNSEGEVTTVVSAGKVSGVVRVKAKLTGSDPLIASVSDELSITTGLADQNSFSLSLENHAPEALNYDGEEVVATVRLADHFNNAVPDGTVVYFTTEGGAIRDAATGTLGSCLTVGSKCTLTWESQNPRPEGNALNYEGLTDGCASSAVDVFAPCTTAVGMGRPYGGRVTITAFAVGEESFTDNDGDGWFTSGDTVLTDLSEVFYDHNEDGYYKTDALATNIGDSEEEFHDFAPTADGYTSADGQYNGLLCSEDGVNSGLCTRELINVREDTVLIMASGDQYFRVQNARADVDSVDLTTDTGVAAASLQVYVADIYNNRPPTGTTISVTTDNGELSGETSWVVADSNSKGPFSFSIALAREAEANKKASGFATITVTSPKGIVSSYQIAVSDDG